MESIGKGKSIGVHKLAANGVSITTFNNIIQADPAQDEGATTGQSNIIQVTTGEAVTAGNMAGYNETDGFYYNATDNNADGYNAVGVFVQNSLAGEFNYINTKSGVLIGVDSTITLTPGGAVYVGKVDANGINITQSMLTAYVTGPPVQDIIQYIGEAFTDDSFILNIKPPIFRFYP